MAAKSSSVVVAYGVQVDKDTPNVGTLTTLAKRSGGFSTSGEESETGTATNRLQDAATLGKLTHTASFEMDFGQDIHDDFLRSAFAAASWNVGAGEDDVSIGTSPLYLTFVVWSPHLTVDAYTQYTGCQVTSAEFTFPKDGAGIIGLSIDLGVANRVFSNTAPWSQLDPAPAYTKLKTCDVLEVLVDDVIVPSIIDSIDFSIQSDSESVYDIRQCDPAEVLLDNATAGGTIVMLHDDDSDALFRNAESGTEFKLEIQIDATTGTDYRIELTRCVNRATGPDFTADNVSVSIPYGAVGDSPKIFRTNV